MVWMASQFHVSFLSKYWSSLWQLWHALTDTTPAMAPCQLHNTAYWHPWYGWHCNFIFPFFLKFCSKCWRSFWQLWHAYNDTTPEMTSCQLHNTGMGGITIYCSFLTKNVYKMLKILLAVLAYLKIHHPKDTMMSAKHFCLVASVAWMALHSYLIERDQ